jgi:serine/threonine-protein kinase
VQETLGQYRILERVGSNGLGEIFRARDTRLGRTVALTAIDSRIADHPDRLDRFLRDARASARVSHPNIAALYEIGDDQGCHYLASEFVAGQTLKSLVGGRPLNPRRAIDLAAQIADALADAFADDLVHGDIRSDSIIVTPRGNAKVVGFGLSAWAAGGDRSRDAAGVDHQADIRSVGALLFEMLTGQPPTDARTPSGVNPDVPAELDPVVSKALVDDLAERYQSAATIAAELRSISAILSVRSDVIKELAAPPIRSLKREVLSWFVILLMVGAISWLVWTASGIK